MFEETLFPLLLVKFKTGLWQDKIPEFVIAYQILDMNEPRWLKLVGFLCNSEVKEHLTSKSGNIECYPIKIEDFEIKHDAEELCDRLLFVRAQIEKAS